MLCNFIEIELRHGCSPVNLLHIFRTPFPRNTSGWLLLKIEWCCFIAQERRISLWMFRSSRPEMSCKKSVLRNFGKFTGKHLCQSLFLEKWQAGVQLNQKWNSDIGVFLRILRNFQEQLFYRTPCASHFMEIFPLVEIGAVFCFYLQKGLEFLTKFWSPDPILNRNILISLNLNSETSGHAQLRDYSFIHTIYKFYDMVSVKNLHWG